MINGWNCDTTDRINLENNVRDIEQELEKMTTLADDLSHICCEMHSELANWDPKAGEEFEKKFNEAMKGE